MPENGKAFSSIMQIKFFIFKGFYLGKDSFGRQPLTHGLWESQQYLTCRFAINANPLLEQNEGYYYSKPLPVEGTLLFVKPN